MRTFQRERVSVVTTGLVLPFRSTMVKVSQALSVRPATAVFQRPRGDIDTATIYRLQRVLSPNLMGPEFTKEQLHLARWLVPTKRHRP